MCVCDVPNVSSQEEKENFNNIIVEGHKVGLPLNEGSLRKGDGQGPEKST